MDYTIDEIKAIVRELLKYDDPENCLYDSDYEDEKEYSFDGITAITKLREFCKKEEE